MDKREFMRLSVHEIKTPISVIHGFADLISYGIISEGELEQTVERIKKEALRITKLVDELAFYIGIKEKLTDINFDTVDIAVLLSRVVRDIKENTEENVEVTVSGEGSIKGDAGLLTVMLLHIIENGIIYNDREIKRLICNIDKKQEKVILTIEDNGIGIDKEEREAVFRCFYRVDKGLSRGNGCNGLGLAISRGIAQIHNGAINIDSKKGKGTKVTIELGE